MLPLGGLIMAIFIGFVVEKSRIEAVMKPALGRTFELWYFTLRYITPLAMIVVMFHLVKSIYE